MSRITKRFERIVRRKSCSESESDCSPKCDTPKPCKPKKNCKPLKKDCSPKKNCKPLKPILKKKCESPRTPCTPCDSPKSPCESPCTPCESPKKPSKPKCEEDYGCDLVIDPIPDSNCSKTKVCCNIMESTFPGNATNGNVAIQYRVAGSRSNPVLVLLHGFGSTSKIWNCVMKSLCQKYYLIAPSLRGFNGSDRPTGSFTDYSFATLALDVQQLLVYLNVRNPIIAGFDIGSFVAVEYYFDFRNDPTYSPSKLILIGPNVSKVYGPAYATLLTAVAGGNIVDVANVFKDNAVNASCPCESNAKLLALKQQVYTDSLDADIFAYQALVDNANNTSFNNDSPSDPTRTFGNINIPVLVMGGDSDLFVLPGGLYLIGLQTPNAFVDLIRGGSHDLQLTHYRIVAMCIYNFIQNIPASCSICLTGNCGC